jgi:hypothetical protein
LTEKRCRETLDMQYTKKNKNKRKKDKKDKREGKRN